MPESQRPPAPVEATRLESDDEIRQAPGGFTPPGQARRLAAAALPEESGPC
jgi:hypothetical protein